MYKVVLLIEKALNDADVELVTGLHGDVDVSFFVVLPGRGDRNKLLQALDDVALGWIQEAAQDLEEEDEGAEVAHRTVEVSVAQLRAAGAEASGETTTGDSPLDRLKGIVERVGADEVVVLTEPHLVEEFFRRDWASRARHKVGVPVLKLFAHNPSTTT